MKRLVTILLSIMMLLTPVLGSAQSAGDGFVYFKITDPFLSVPAGENNMDIDLSGLELLFAVEENETGADVLLSALGGGVEAVAGCMTIDETGIFAIVKGMENAVGIPMSTIEMLATEAAAEMQSIIDSFGTDVAVIGGADGPTNIVVEGDGTFDFGMLFTEEALNEFNAALETFIGSIALTEPIDDVLLSDNETPAQRIDYTISGESLGAFLKAAADLCMSNEQFAQGFNSAMVEAGMEGADISEFVDLMMQETGLSLEGSLYMTENGDLYTDNYLFMIVDTDEAGDPVYDVLNIELSRTSDADGEYVYLCVYPPEDGDVFDLFMGRMYSAEVEGGIDYYAQLYLYEMEDDTFEVDESIVFYSGPYYDEAGVVNTIYSVDFASEDEAASFGLNTYGDDLAHGGYVFLIMPDGSEAYIGYDGAADELTENGQLWFELYEGETLLGQFNCGIEFGTDTTGESIAYDFASVPYIDIITIDDAAAQALEEDALAAVFDGLTVLGDQVPILGLLLSMSGIDGTMAG